MLGGKRGRRTATRRADRSFEHVERLALDREELGCEAAQRAVEVGARMGGDLLPQRVCPAAQMPVEEKVKHGDFVIDTSSDLAATRRQVELINSKLRELAAST